MGSNPNTWGRRGEGSWREGGFHRWLCALACASFSSHRASTTGHSGKGVVVVVTITASSNCFGHLIGSFRKGKKNTSPTRLSWKERKITLSKTFFFAVPNSNAREENGGGGGERGKGKKEKGGREGGKGSSSRTELPTRPSPSLCPFTHPQLLSASLLPPPTHPSQFSICAYWPQKTDRKKQIRRDALDIRRVLHLSPGGDTLNQEGRGFCSYVFCFVLFGCLLCVCGGERERTGGGGGTGNGTGRKQKKACNNIFFCLGSFFVHVPHPHPFPPPLTSHLFPHTLVGRGTLRMHTGPPPPLLLLRPVPSRATRRTMQGTHTLCHQTHNGQLSNVLSKHRGGGWGVCVCC